MPHSIDREPAGGRSQASGSPSLPLRTLALVAFACASACSGGGGGGGGPVSVSPLYTTVHTDAQGGKIADGVDVATVTVTVRSAPGVSVAGRRVELEVSGSGHAVVQPLAPTEIDGVAFGTVSSTVAETKQVTVVIDPGAEELRLADAAQITFLGDPDTISATRSTIAADAVTGVVADGVTPVRLTVTVRDANDNPVAGQLVELAVTGSGNHLAQPVGLTDADGIAVGELAATVAETKSATATVNPGSGEVDVSPGVEITFVGDPETIDAVFSTAVAAPVAGVPADGAATSTVTVTVRDANGNPVAGQLVTLEATGTGNTLTQPAAPTDPLGQAIGTIASTDAEIKTVTATVNLGPNEVVLSQTPIVEFIGDPGDVSAVLSSAVAAPSSGVTADGATVSTVTVTVRDGNGNPLPGKPVVLSSTGAGNTIVQPVGPTDGSGRAIGTIASTVAETKVVTATVDPGPEEVVLIQTPSIEFIGDAANLSSSLSFAFAIPAANVLADGSSASVVYAFLRDANDNPVPGQTIELAATGSGNTLTQPGGPTDEDGLATGSIASTVPEIKTITVTADPSGAAVVFDHQPTVEFILDPLAVSAAASGAAANPAVGVVADGAAVSSITVTVRNGNGDPLAGHTVELSATGSGNTITQPAGVTNASGRATGTIASTVAETKVITATVDPGPAEVVLDEQPTVEFVADAGNLSASLSSAIAQPDSGVSADGVEISTIVVTVIDALGNPVPDTTVQLTATGRGNVLTQPLAPTDPSGVATGTLASSVSETKTITVTADPGGENVVLDDVPIVDFTWVLGNTYYVRQTGTDPGGCSGGTSPATAWATLSKAASCVSAGDTVYVGAGTYVGTVELTSSGTALEPIRFIADTEGLFTGDAGAVIIDGAVANQTIHLNGAAWNELVGFTVIGASGAGPPCGGILAEGANAVLRGNTVYGNLNGIYVVGVDGVVIESNGISGNGGAESDGIVVSNANNAVVRNNLIYDNGRHGLSIAAGSDGSLSEGNAIYANGADGIHVVTPSNTATLRNNIVTDNLDDGVEANPPSIVVSSYNDVFGNAGQDIVGYSPGAGDFSADPLYVDPDGPDDMLGGAQGDDDRFHLDEGGPSPAIDAGSDDAAEMALEDGSTLAETTTRIDELLDGTGADGATVNLGYHYPVGGDSLSTLDVGDTRLVCGSGASRRLLLRDWDVSGGSWFAALNAPPAGSTIRWTVNALSPQANDEELMAVLADDGAATDLRLLRWSGSGWLSDWRSAAIAVGNAKRRGFDLAYEASGGDALAVYAIDTETPVYRLLTNGAWSAETTLPLNDGGGPNPDTNSGTVLWIELVAQPSASEIVLLFADANDDLVAIVWDGDQWLTATASTLEANLKTNPVTGEVDNRIFDAAYEESSGDLMVAWGRRTTAGFWWSMQVDGSTAWSAPVRVTGAPVSGVPHFMDLAGEPAGERIVAGSFDMGDGAERLGLAIWDGSAWIDDVELDSQTRNVNDTGTGDFAGAVGWVGTAGQAICLYPDNQSGTIDWASWSASMTWELRPDISVGAKGQTESVQLLTYRDRPLVLALFSDSSGDLYSACYDGVDWTVSGSGSAIVTGISGMDTMPFFGAVRED